MSNLHVVTGAGPVGTTVALRLAAAGQRVRLLTRSGSGPEHPLIERRRVDVSQPAQLGEAFDGAVAVYHCIHGSRYAAKAWRAELPVAEQAVMDAAAAIGAVVVFPESVYSYGLVDGPITEDSPRTADFGKPAVRRDLLRARQSHAADTVSVVSSDFIGPYVRMAHAGERMLPNILEGKAVQLVGNPDTLHSFTYIPDLADAMIRGAADPALWNTVLHAPTPEPLTTRQLVAELSAAAGVSVPKLAVLPGWAMRAVGVVNEMMREMAEMSYLFTKPLVLDSTASQQRIGQKPTPMAVIAAETVAWWRSQ